MLVQLLSKIGVSTNCISQSEERELALGFIPEAYVSHVAAMLPKKLQKDKSHRELMDACRPHIKKYFEEFSNGDYCIESVIVALINDPCFDD